MTSNFNKGNLQQRPVLTPLGIGTLFGVNDKDNPTLATVTLKIEGFKVPQARVFDVEDVEEIIRGENGKQK
jgi:hypothetical protein